jgi:hypothetical protein
MESGGNCCQQLLSHFAFYALFEQLRKIDLVINKVFLEITPR